MTETLLTGVFVLLISTFVLVMQALNFRRAHRSREIYVGRTIYKRAEGVGWFKAAYALNAVAALLTVLVLCGGFFLIVAALAGWDQ